MNQRNQSLDTLRGFAILAMVLSSSIAFGILPGWMYHAQVPPPKHVYDPALPGITWVDLVFPFFLFSMGAAFPLAFRKKIAAGMTGWELFRFAAKRFLLLVFFAIFTLQLRAWVIEKDPGDLSNSLSILAFGLLFLMYIDTSRRNIYWKIAGYFSFAVAAFLLFFIPYQQGKTFDPSKSDIIIIVLANMAFFGSLIWYFTRNNIMARMAILPFILAIFLAAKVEGSWNKIVFDFTPADWMYKFYYLKYLFIIIPGSIVGDWIADNTSKSKIFNSRINWILAGSLLAIIILNTVLLYTRDLTINLLLSGFLLAIVLWYNKYLSLSYQKILNLGAALLLLGLFLEATEGGIKKDPSTFSYYFVTGGLAICALLFFELTEWHRLFRQPAKFLALVGQNPMVAYVSGNLLLLPLLKITGGITILNMMQDNIPAGIFRGFLFTSIVAIITVWFTKQKWFWKT